MSARPPSPKAQLAAFLSRFPTDTAALAKRCLTKLRRAFPGANELVYDYPQSVVVGFGVSEQGYEAIVALAIDLRGLRLYVDKSTPDPKRLLAGSGTKVRSVPLKSAAELESGDIHALVQAAIRHAGAKLSGTGPTRLIIKTAAKERPDSSKRRT